MPETGDYAITLTLSKLLMNKQMKTQYNKSVDSLKTYLFGKSTFVIELTKDSNVHYHGIGKWESKGPIEEFVKPRPEVFFNKLHKQNVKIFGSQKCFKKTDNYYGWVCYILKNVYETWTDFEKEVYPIVNDEYKVFEDILYKARKEQGDEQTMKYSTDVDLEMVQTYCRAYLKNKEVI